MLITGLQKLTTLDYPEHIACTIFTQGCNLKCPFCHNASLVEPSYRDKHYIMLDEVYSFLESRKRLLDGVVITGGEPLIWYDTPTIINSIKELGFKVKLDTNGSYPETLKRAIEVGVDYIAMDIKNSRKKYARTIGHYNYKLANFEESINIIKNSGVDYEFRTTLVNPLHNLDDIKDIANWIGDKNTRYALQNYKDSGDILNDQGFSGFSREEIEIIRDNIKDQFKEVIIRGV